MEGLVSWADKGQSKAPGQGCERKSQAPMPAQACSVPRSEGVSVRLVSGHLELRGHVARQEQAGQDQRHRDWRELACSQTTGVDWGVGGGEGY